MQHFMVATSSYKIHSPCFLYRTDADSRFFIFYSLYKPYGRSGNRIPVGRGFRPVETGPGAHPASCTLGTGSLLGVKYGRSVLLIPHPILVPWSWMCRAIPLHNLWATTGPVTGTLPFL